MTIPEDLGGRFARLRDEWPTGSIVDDVMDRIRTSAPVHARHRGRLLAGLAASGLVALLGLAWLILASQPTTLLAAVQDGLKRARSAHLVMTAWADGGAEHRAEIWYRRDQGLRFESPEQVIVEDGKFQWSWRRDAGAGELIAVRQRTPGFFTTQLPQMIALPNAPEDWSRVRSPELDRQLSGRTCQGFTLTAPDAIHRGQPGAAAGTLHAVRALVLAEADGVVHEITVQERGDDAKWRNSREIRIEYDVQVTPERVALELPAGARVVDRDEAFQGRYPLEIALHRVELGGLILAVHDLQPLIDREGFYVVSSVRGTPEFLKAFPPRRRPVNPEVIAIDVAFQPGSNMMQGSKYDRIVLGSATRDGVEFSWWLVVPRKFFEIKDGKRVYSPESDQSWMPGEPGRLDDLPGAARVPLSATYWDEKHRDANGVQQGVSTWAQVPLRPERPPATIEEVAGRARRDLLLMGLGGAGGLLGVAADTKAAPNQLRGLSHFAPETVSDAEFAAAVRRGFDDLRACDEVRPVRPEDMFPPVGVGTPKR
jgi:hypothetical protein